MKPSTCSISLNLIAVISLAFLTACKSTGRAPVSNLSDTYDQKYEKALLVKYGSLKEYIDVNYLPKVSVERARQHEAISAADAAAKAKTTIAEEEAKQAKAEGDKAVAQGAVLQAAELEKRSKAKLALLRAADAEEARRQSIANRPSVVQSDPTVKDLTAKELRNQILRDLMTLVDAEYVRYKQDLFYGRARFSFLSDLALLGTTTAGTISGGAHVKTILSAAGTAIVGVRTSVNENYFRDKTSEALIAKMDALRDAKAQAILLRFDRTPLEYDLQAGLNDLQDYLDQGNIITALVQLSIELAPAATEAKKSLADVKAKLFGGEEAYMDQLLQRIAAIKEAAKQKTVCDTVAEIMGGAFKTKYDAVTGANRYTALLAAKNSQVADLAVNSADRKAKFKAMADALETALK